MASGRRFCRANCSFSIQEAPKHPQLQLHRLTLVGHLHGHQRGCLILRAPAVLAAQIGLIDLHRACQPTALIALPHGVFELVLKQPGGAFDAQLAPLLQGRDAVLGLRQHVDGEGLGGERQLGGLAEGVGHQREPTLAAVALEGGAAGGEAVELVRVAAEAAVAAAPARVEKELISGCYYRMIFPSIRSKQAGHKNETPKRRLRKRC